MIKRMIIVMSMLMVGVAAFAKELTDVQQAVFERVQANQTRIKLEREAKIKADEVEKIEKQIKKAYDIRSNFIKYAKRAKSSNEWKEKAKLYQKKSAREREKLYSMLDYWYESQGEDYTSVWLDKYYELNEFGFNTLRD